MDKNFTKIVEGNKYFVNVNKYLAKFMGCKYSNPFIPPDHLWLPVHGICNYTTIDLGRGKILEYHSSWDWLIPVVIKIMKISVLDMNQECGKLKMALKGIMYELKDINTVYDLASDFVTKYITQDGNA